MLQLFVQSLLIGGFVATVLFAGGMILRRVTAGPRKSRLAPGQALRCVQPLDLSER